MRLVKCLLLLLLVVAVLVAGMLFSIENTIRVPLNLVVLQLEEQRLSVWLLIFFAVGGALGIAASSVSIMRLRTEQHLLRRKLARAEKELDQLRTSPLKS